MHVAVRVPRNASLVEQLNSNAQAVATARHPRVFIATLALGFSVVDPLVMRADVLLAFVSRDR